MSSELMSFFRFDYPDEEAFIQIKIWKVKPNVKGSLHEYKYSCAYVVNKICVLRYDNEAGKGDHKHIDGQEMPLQFADIEDLVAQFDADVQMMRRKQ